MQSLLLKLKYQRKK